MFSSGPRALAAGVLTLVAGVSQAAGPHEWGAGAWHVFAPSSGFSPHPAFAVDARFKLTDFLSIRPGVRVGTPISILGEATGSGREKLGSLTQGTLMAPFVFGWEGDRFGAAIAAGFVYHTRLSRTREDAKGTPVRDDAPELGTIDQLWLTDHPGIDAALEGSVVLGGGFRLVAAGGYSRAVSRLVVRTLERELPEPSWPVSLSSFHLSLSVRWRPPAGNAAKTPPAAPP